MAPRRSSTQFFVIPNILEGFYLRRAPGPAAESISQDHNLGLEAPSVHLRAPTNCATSFLNDERHWVILGKARAAHRYLQLNCRVQCSHPVDIR